MAPSQAVCGAILQLLGLPGFRAMARMARFGFLFAAFAMGVAAWPIANAGDDQESRRIMVTLQSDGKHCAVRKVIIPCADLAIHLRDTLKLPTSTMINLRAGRIAHYEAVREVLTIIEKSGYRYPVALVTGPKSAKDR
jgi:biopolymer transport protein ExbD